MMGLIIALVVICFLIWMAKSILGAFGIGEPLSTVIYVLIVAIVIFGYVLPLLSRISLPGLR